MGFPDDDPKSEFKPDDPDLLRNRSIPGRLIVMSAGIIANCIFAFSVLFAQVDKPHTFHVRASLSPADVAHYRPYCAMPSEDLSLKPMPNC